MKIEVGQDGVTRVSSDKPLTGCEYIVLSKTVIHNPRHIEGHPLFTAPWSVDYYEDVYGVGLWSVRSAEGHLIIQPGEHNQAWCESLVRSRNSGTVEEDVAYQIAIKGRAIDGARVEVDRVRAHFTDELNRVMKTNRSLQNAIVAARVSGSTLLLPAWCQADWETP